MSFRAERIPLPLPWGGTVYPTVIDSPSVRLLIDSGHTAAPSRQALLSALSDRPPDILLLTHAHQDHYGGLPALMERYPNLLVYAAECARPYYEDQERTVLTHRDRLERFAHRAGLTGDLLEQVLSGYEVIAQSGCTAELERGLVDGDQLEFGEVVVRVHHHPGHHHHHLVFELPELSAVVTGDNVFETNLTPPQVRFDDDGLRVATLPTLLDSLERLADLGGRGLPSHGPELADVSVTARRAHAAYRRTAQRVTRAWAQFETPPSLPDLMEAVFGEVPLPFVGLRLGFLLGYVDWVGLGEHYR